MRLWSWISGSSLWCLELTSRREDLARVRSRALCPRYPPRYPPRSVLTATRARWSGCFYNSFFVKHGAPELTAPIFCKVASYAPATSPPVLTQPAYGASTPSTDRAHGMVLARPSTEAAYGASTPSTDGAYGASTP
eukprot:1510809-Rhodomonas_salina.1